MSAMLPVGLADLDPDHNAHHDALHRRFNAVVSVLDHGAAGDGVTDDTTAIQDAVDAAAGGGMVDFPPGQYVVTGTITVGSDVRLQGRGAVIEQTTALTPTIDVSSASDVAFVGLDLEGLGSDYVNASSVHGATGIRVGFDGNRCARIRIDGCRLNNHAGNGIDIHHTDGLVIANTTVAGPGSPAVSDDDQYGTCIRLGEGCTQIRIHHCELSGAAQGIGAGSHGIIGLSIAGNLIHDIHGQHGMYLGGGSDLTIVGNVVADTYAHSIKVQLSSSAAADAVGVVIMGNRLSGANGHAILLTQTDGTYVVRRFVVASNVIDLAAGTADGIALRHAVDGVLSDNVISGGRHAISAIDGIEGVRISGNRMNGAGRNGVYLEGVTRVQITDNTIEDVGSELVVAERNGIAARGTCDDVTIDGNVIRDATATNMQYGIHLRSTLVGQETFALTRNDVQGASAQAVRVNTTTPTSLRGWAGNRLSGASGELLGTITEVTGDTAIRSFFGVQPVDRQALPGAGVVTADDLRDALIALGLCE